MPSVAVALEAAETEEQNGETWSSGAAPGRGGCSCVPSWPHSSDRRALARIRDRQFSAEVDNDEDDGAKVDGCSSR